jgi:hypothetical protein
VEVGLVDLVGLVAQEVLEHLEEDQDKHKYHNNQ